MNEHLIQAVAIASVSGLIGVVLRDLDRRLSSVERRLDGSDRLATAVAELTVEVRHLKDRAERSSAAE